MMKYDAIIITIDDTNSPMFNAFCGHYLLYEQRTFRKRHHDTHCCQYQWKQYRRKSTEIIISPGQPWKQHPIPSYQQLNPHKTRKVCTHTGNITYVIAYVIGNSSRVQWMIFGNTGFNFTQLGQRPRQQLLYRYRHLRVRTAQWKKHRKKIQW